MSKLVCIAGMNTGDQFALHEGKNLVGRDNDCNIVLFDKKSSHKHCVFYKREKHYSIEDLESSNGTRLNGKFIKPHKTYACEVGDLIQVGETSLKISERPVGDAVDQMATDVAAELQGGKYDKLLKDSSMNLARSQQLKSRKKAKGLSKIIQVFFPNKR